MRILFDFSPDDNAAEQIIMEPATRTDYDLLSKALATGNPSNVLQLPNTRVAGGQPATRLFRVGRISNLRSEA